MSTWLSAILSAVISFILETQIDDAIADLVDTLFNGNTLVFVVVNTLSFLAIFSLLFAVFNKAFGSHRRNGGGNGE